MQRMKDEGKDILNPIFRDVTGAPALMKATKKAELKMTNDIITRKITLDELKAHSSPTEPWFVVAGEGTTLPHSSPSTV